MNPRTILFIHQAFPGQFGALAKSLVAEGHRVFALAMNPQEALPGVNLVRYMPVRRQESDKWPFLMREFDVKLIRAESAMKAMKAMKARGLNPDVIYAHPGWGETLFVRNVWPGARYVVYAEWFYNIHGQEVNFDPAFPPLNEEEEMRIAFKNTPFLHALSECDAAIAPTEWQKSRFPAWTQEKIQVVHDGLQLDEIAAVMPKTLGIPSLGLKLRKGMPIVTYCARHLEPVRGFHYFMRALPAVFEANPETHVIVMGQDAGVQNVGYGKENSQGTSWRKAMEKELGDSVDWNRVHFLGLVERKIYLAMLKLSACHVYLTTPFILSWSFLEAAGLGLPIVASDTPPVREFSQLRGLERVAFDDVDAISDAVAKRLRTDTNFFDDNVTLLKQLDQARTLPVIKDILLSGSHARDMGGPLQSVVLIEEDEDDGPVKKSETGKKRTARQRKSAPSETA